MAVRCGSSIARERGRARAIDFDFEPLLSGPKGVAAFWAFARAAAVRGDDRDSLRSHVVASDVHASRVCRSLGDGVLAALPALTTALAIHPRARTDRAIAFDQALTLVYRVLFLLFAEARALVPVWNDVYRTLYTIDSLIRRARLRQGFGGASSASGTGLWKGFQAISRLAHAGCKAGDLDVTAFNGRLFSPRHSPLVEQRRVSDDVMRDVLLALANEHSPHGLRRISYHDLGVEQLGSVYERILEHEPSSHGAAIVLTRTSSERKTSGSFYTPQALTGFLVRKTLAPLVEGRTASEILQLRIVDPSMGSGAFLVAACGFLADCCEQAMIRDGHWPAAEVSAADRASLRRQVAERCLYGVDLQSDGRAARARVAVADHARSESAAHLSRSPSCRRQQPDWRAPQRSVATAGLAQWPGAFSAAALRRSARGRRVGTRAADSLAPLRAVGID